MSKANFGQKVKCLRLLHELTENVIAPQPNGSITWTTGIESVEVTDPCGSSPLLTIHGQGFGVEAASGVGVIAATWNVKAESIVYRSVHVVSWSDTQIVVQPGSNVVGGMVAFANVSFINMYNNWADNENQHVIAAMREANCPGYGPPAKPVIWRSWSQPPTYSAAATYSAGVPRIITDLTLEPSGHTLDLWSSNTMHLKTNEVFRISWKAENADTAILHVSSGSTQILVDAGHPASGVIGTSGSVVLVAPSRPTVIEFTVEASNTDCSTMQLLLRIVVTGPALQPATITVLQSLPSSTIQLVAEKRTVVRIDWWTAVPQVPVGEELTVQAFIEVNGPAAPWPNNVILRPGASTANDPPLATDPPLELLSGRAFSSLLEYQQWIAKSNNNPDTFNVVLPAKLCVGNVTIKATIIARNRDGRVWNITASSTVEFHNRRRILIRYRPWGLINPPQGQTPITAPTDQQCKAALRAACSMLPIPDPEIIRLPGPWDINGNEVPVENNGQLVEGLIAERGTTPTPAWQDEIWFVVGPAGVGGYAPGPWTGATEATAVVTAHEISHLFNQNHLNLCGGTDGDDPTLFPTNGNVNAIGWDMWNNRPVRNATDFMADECRTQGKLVWISPERWKRIFLNVGP